MLQIFKYTLDSPTKRLELPRGFRVLSVGCQNGNVVFWAEIDNTEPKTESAIFRSYNTGNVVDSTLAYLGTVQIPGEPEIVWHIYMARK